MKRLAATTALLAALGAAPAALAADPAPRASAKPKPADWSDRMRKLDRTLQQLLVDLSSDDRYRSKAGQKRIQEGAKEIANLSHEMTGKMAGAPDADPSLRIIAGLFAQEARRAYSMFRYGQTDYARELLRSTTGYCVACHTRNSSGPNVAARALPEDFRKLGAMDQALYLASTRQFDRAFDAFEAIVANESARRGRGLEWERAARTALVIATRVQKDPERAQRIADRVAGATDAPFFLRQEAAQWKKDIASWREEPPRKAETEEGLFAEAMRLFTQAKARQKFPADRSADLLYLRSQAAIHDLLAVAPDGRRAAEALLLAGNSYEVLHGLQLWDLPEAYYFACVRKAPHSELGEACFRSYEESVHIGYSGSGGVDIPPEVEEQLRALGELARPVTPEAKKPN